MGSKEARTGLLNRRLRVSFQYGGAKRNALLSIMQPKLIFKRLAIGRRSQIHSTQQEHLASSPEDQWLRLPG
jgi:hypothetical protein